jgi:hypothetical protein
MERALRGLGKARRFCFARFVALQHVPHLLIADTEQSSDLGARNALSGKGANFGGRCRQVFHRCAKIGPSHGGPP